MLAGERIADVERRASRMPAQRCEEGLGWRLNPLKWLLEATTGIEPVYTVLQTVA